MMNPSFLLLSIQCVAGTSFSASGNEPGCQTCAADATCTAGVKTACTKTTDTVCHVACAAGTSFSASGNEPGCQTCAADSTCTAGVRTACTPTSDTVCGVEGDCVAGKYAQGDSCVNCAVGHFAQAASTTCVACPSGRSVAAGTGKLPMDCLNCVAGKYALQGSYLGCINCAVGTWAAEEANFCTACVNGKSVAAGPAGKQPVDCLKCVAGKYAYSAAPGACINCRPGSYSLEGATTCTNCPAGRSATCTAGVKTSCTETTDTVCHVPCVAGTSFSASGNTPCNACTVGATCLFGVKTACTKTTDTVCQVYDKVCFK